MTAIEEGLYIANIIVLSCGIQISFAAWAIRRLVWPTIYKGRESNRKGVFCPSGSVVNPSKKEGGSPLKRIHIPGRFSSINI